MYLEELKKDLTSLKEQYGTKENNIFDYYNKVINVLEDYAELTGNYSFREAIPYIVDGKDLYSEDYCEEVYDVSKNLYIFNSWEISSLKCDDINEIIDKSISCLSKEKDFDIC